MQTMKNEASHSEFRERAVRYLSGEMGSDERNRFEQEMAADKEKQHIFSEYRSIWSGVDQLAAQSKYDLDAEWEQFSGKIGLDGEQGAQAEMTAPRGVQDHAEDAGSMMPQVRRLPRRVFAWRIAAVIVAGLAGLAGWLVLRDTIGYEQFAAEQGTEVVELSDGSVVTLNAGSTFRYDLDDPHERKVILEGEAFFEVAKDSSRPFTIEAGAAIVQVLGTSFNVNAYDKNGVVEVTVATGLVAMSAKNRLENQIILNPGNSGIYDKTAHRLELVSKADPNAIAWKTREIVFSETPLDEVIKVISHVYQAEIQLADASLAPCPITVSFRDQELGAVLRVITNTLDLQLERKGGAVVLSGDGCD